jgi:hypothetical protein
MILRSNSRSCKVIPNHDGIIVDENHSVEPE